MNQGGRKTLAGDLIIGLAVIVTASTVLVTATHFWLHYRETVKEFSVKSEEYVGFLQDSLSKPLWNFDYETAEKIAESMMKNEMISAIRIINARREAVFDEWTSGRNGAPQMLREVPIFWEERPVGTLTLRLTRASSRSALLDRFWGSLATLLVTLVGIIYVTRAFVSRFFRRPMRDLMGRMDELMNGRPSSREGTFRHKETLEIMEKFTEMAERIDHREKSLEGMNESLKEEIRERERLASTLQEREQQWRDIIHFAPVGIYQATLDGRILLANPKLAEIFGFESPEDLLTEIDSFTDLYVDPADRADLIKNALAEGAVINAEVRYRHRDGGEIWGSLSARNTTLGGEAAFEGFILDMTARKRAEEALRHSQRRMAQIINFLPDPTFVVDVENRVIAWNRALEELTGVSAAEMLGKGDFEYAIPFYGERRPVLIDLVQTWNEETARRYIYVRRKGGTLISETRNPPFRPDDACFWNAACPLFDDSGRFAGAIETIRDISEAKRIEHSLRESEFRFRSFFNSSPDGVAIVALNGRVLDVNKSLLNMSRYSREELLDREFNRFIPPEHHPKVETALGHFERGIAPDIPFEIEYINSTGDRKPASLRAWLMTDRESRPVAVGVFLKDTSREKTLASEKAKLEKQLQQSQKLEAIGTLAGGIAHDFNNILAGMIGYAELIHCKYSEGTPALADYLDRILEGGNRAREIIRQILQFSREDDGDHCPVGIRLVVKEAVKLLRATLPATIQISESISVDTGMVMGDATRTHQVVMNLCTNAYHAMRETGGELRIGLENHVLEAPREAHGSRITPGPYLKLTVTDTGHGIPRNIIDRIFDPYFTTKKVGEGTGLGLSVTLGIVKSLKGLLEVESSPGLGTAFTVFFPAGRSGPCQGDPDVGDIPLGRQERILLVDDEPYFLNAIQEHLELLGYQVSSFSNCADALDIFRENPAGYDLVLTDQSMPGMSGIQLSAHIREINPTIPIILCTGFSDQITKETAIHFSISRFLMKPVNRITIARTVSDLLLADSGTGT